MLDTVELFSGIRITKRNLELKFIKKIKLNNGFCVSLNLFANVIASIHFIYVQRDFLWYFETN